jgi:hypothetical protein
MLVQGDDVVEAQVAVPSYFQELETLYCHHHLRTL